MSIIMPVLRIPDSITSAIFGANDLAPAFNPLTVMPTAGIASAPSNIPTPYSSAACPKLPRSSDLNESLADKPDCWNDKGITNGVASIRPRPRGAPLLSPPNTLSESLPAL